LASGQISKNQALIFCLALFFLGFLILISLNKTTILIGLISVPLIIIYPLAKRFTNYPQIFLGIVFNLGIIMGYTSISNNFDQQIILFYIVGVILTFLYDTIYAYQDIDDDLKVGIKSSAIKIGKNKQILYFLALIIFILTITAGKLFFLTNIYHFIAFLGFLWLIYVIYSLDFTSKQNVAAKVKQNCYFILLINIAILASN
jgi:4-hydroxybenzoate polyprenyltransferase